jgi:hypothetical protein
MAPATLPELEIYVAHVAEVMLHLRDEGHVLSSIDQHLVEQWWEAGFPLDPVLRELATRGKRLKARKKTPRGLPLRSFDRYVRKIGETSRVRAVGAAPALRTGGHLPALHTLTQRLAQEPEHGPARQALVELAELPEDAGPGESFSRFLAIGRRYYDALLAAMSAAERQALRDGVLADLGGAAARMAPDALEETLGELVRREVRRRDPVLDPTTWSEP